jgi:hypothetical protein
MGSKEDELITHIAAGSPVWLAIAATEGSKPAKRRGFGCLSVLLLAAALAALVA